MRNLNWESRHLGGGNLHGGGGACRAVALYARAGRIRDQERRVRVHAPALRMAWRRRHPPAEAFHAEHERSSESRPQGVRRHASGQEGAWRPFVRRWHGGRDVPVCVGTRRIRPQGKGNGQDGAERVVRRAPRGGHGRFAADVRRRMGARGEDREGRTHLLRFRAQGPATSGRSRHRRRVRRGDRPRGAHCADD